MQLTSILKFILAALLVAAIGGLAGWYVFLRGERAATIASDQGRGSGIIPAFGSAIGSTYQNIVDTLSGESESRGEAQSAPRLWQVSKNPVAAFGFATSTRVVFIERATGNVLEADPTTSATVRLSNTLYPKMYDGLVAEGGVVLRSVESDAVTTFAALYATSTGAGTSSPRSLAGSYLPQNIVSIAARGKELFFIVKDPRGGSIGVTSNWLGTAQKKLFNSPLSEWLAWWLPDGRAIIAQKPIDGIDGFAFTVSASGALSSLISGIPGLTVLPHPTTAALLYGSSGLGGTTLYARASATADPLELSLGTSADKCVWLPARGEALKRPLALCAVPTEIPAGGFLEGRFQGLRHSTDHWWRVDATTGATEKFFTTDSTLSIDVENPVIDPSGQFIAFKNAADQSLWMLRISAQ